MHVPRRAHRVCAIRSWRTLSGFALALCLLLALPGASANVLIQRTITINGNMSDWTQAPDILTNPGQFAEDARGLSQDCSNPIQPGQDLDCVVQTDHRDLRRFAFTFDDDYLFMFVSRWTSANPQSGWVFYLDIDNSGVMTGSDKVLQVLWQGNIGATDIYLHDYVPDDPAGDPLVIPNLFCDPGSPFPEACEESADGYTMPGSVTNSVLLESLTGGQPGGLQMETRVAWTALNPNATGPFSVGFHISSNRGGCRRPAGSGGGQHGRPGWCRWRQRTDLRRSCSHQNRTGE